MRILSTDNSAKGFNYFYKEATYLLDKVNPGQRVVIALPNSLLLAALLIKCFERHIVSVPLDPKSLKMRFRSILQDSDSCALITERGIEHLGTSYSAHPDDRLIIYTSGTTGEPKGVVLQEAALMHNARATADLHDFSNAVHLTPLPLYHVNALCMSLLGTLISNGTLVLAQKFTPQLIFDAVSHYNVATLSLVPSLITSLLKDSPKWPECLRYIITAASPLSQETAREFFKYYGAKLRQGYGLSEATNFSFMMPLLNTQDFEKHYVTQQPPVGYPISGTNFRIKDGEVQVRGPNVMSGYWNNPIATKNAFDDGWLRTGDLGEMRENFLVLQGRRKDIILRGGETLSPLEIEEIFKQYGIEAVAAGIESKELGEEIAVGVQTPLEAIEVLQLCRDLPANRKPALIRVGVFLTTSTGKIQRKAMFATAPLLKERGVKRLEYFFTLDTSRWIITTSSSQDLLGFITQDCFLFQYDDTVVIFELANKY